MFHGRVGIALVAASKAKAIAYYIRLTGAGARGACVALVAAGKGEALALAKR